jgi:hypothetical protein
MQDPAQVNARRPRPGTRKRLEPLALASLLTALVLGWCPLTALVAIVLGGMALHRMKREAPDGRTEERRGAGLAFAGMGIATAILLGELWLLGDLQTTVMDSMESQATAAIEAGLRVQAPGAAPASTPDAAELLWDDAFHAPDEAARAAFAGAVAAQTGQLRQVSITNRTVEGLAEPTITTAFNANGERGTVFGTATFATVPGTLPPILRLRLLTVELDGTRQTLPPTELPNAPTGAAPTPEATKP